MTVMSTVAPPAQLLVEGVVVWAPLVAQALVQELQARAPALVSAHICLSSGPVNGLRQRVNL